MKPVLLILVLALGGCQHISPPRPSDKSAICRALVGPIKYNTENKLSKRYAGVLLGLDLKQRNQIGVGLGCPQYR